MSEAEPQSASCRICSRAAIEETNYCSVSCSLAGKIPLGDGGPLPATWPLAWTAAIGFAFFNQILMASMAWVKRVQLDAPLEGRFAAISLMVGMLWLMLVLVLWARETPKRKQDYLNLTIALLAGFCLYLYQGELLGLAFALIICNTLITLNLGRGVFVLWRTSKKREK